MHKQDLDRVKFYSKEDMSGGYHLSKAEPILKGDKQLDYSDINDILEIYNIKKYFDTELYLTKWTQENVRSFKQKVTGYGKTVGIFISNINDTNVIALYEKVLRNYIEDFWELINNQNAFKRISKDNFKLILSKEPHIIHTILHHKQLVEQYDSEIRTYLLTYSESAEILLSVYEVQDDFRKNLKFLPKSLSLADKENIIYNYLDLQDVNLNYIELIQNARNRSDFKISDKTRLKAKRLYKSETEKFFVKNEGVKYGVTVTFVENAPKIKDGYIDERRTMHNSYSIDYIKQNNNPYLLFQNFKYLFEYVDYQNRINLISKKSRLGLLENIMGIRSQNEYRVGTVFSLSEMTSQGQIAGYNKIVNGMGTSLEEILHSVFTVAFQERYNFAKNARFFIPSARSNFEKVRLLAPEFESVLKQFKLFVEDGSIDFELLQISSSPTSIKDIPSLNQNKYIYFNADNKEMFGCSNLFFSDQSLLAYVEPFKEEKYRTFFDLLANEQMKFNNYKEHQKTALNYLISEGLITVDDSGYIQLTNTERVLILKDLYDNEFASFYRYPIGFQKETQKMISENIILFGSSLFSKPEQAYFNYFLNKSEFSNGLDLRNSYLHGTQANPDETHKHEYAYFSYMKLLVLTMLKIDDDLQISNAINNKT